MRKFFLLFVACLLTISFLPAAFLLLAIEDKPHVARPVLLTPEHIERAKQIIDKHRYQVHPGKLATVNVLSEDADIAANYLANHFGKGSAQVKLAERHALIYLSLPLPSSIVDGYLNFEMKLMQTAGFPKLQTVHIGNISLPDFVANFLVSQGIQWLQRSPEFRAGFDSVKLVRMSQDKVSITYRWTGGFIRENNSILALDEQEQTQVLRYHSLLVRNSQRHDSKTTPLSQVLPPLMRLAAKHSVNGDAIAENRAMILATTFHVLGMPPKLLGPEIANWSRSAGQIVTIDGRDDFAKHFIVSAAITAYTDTALSNAIGLYKEMEDARSGSGFSFNDIAADIAGTRFGEKAVASQNSARYLQQLVASGLTDSDLMPLWSDLPEFMSEAEFKQRFGGIDAPAYQRMMKEIEGRVSALRVLR